MSTIDTPTPRSEAAAAAYLHPPAPAKHDAQRDSRARSKRSSRTGCDTPPGAMWDAGRGPRCAVPPSKIRPPHQGKLWPQLSRVLCRHVAGRVVLLRVRHCAGTHTPPVAAPRYRERSVRSACVVGTEGVAPPPSADGRSDCGAADHVGAVRRPCRIHAAVEPRDSNVATLRMSANHRRSTSTSRLGVGGAGGARPGNRGAGRGPAPECLAGHLLHVRPRTRPPRREGRHLHGRPL